MRQLLLARQMLIAIAAYAHVVRPAYLELHEGAAGEFRVLWKAPMRGEMRLALGPAFRGRTENLGPIATL